MQRIDKAIRAKVVDNSLFLVIGEAVKTKHSDIKCIASEYCFIKYLEGAYSGLPQAYACVFKWIEETTTPLQTVSMRAISMVFGTGTVRMIG